VDVAPCHFLISFSHSLEYDSREGGREAGNLRDCMNHVDFN
jgi:hypothetical protein